MDSLSQLCLGAAVGKLSFDLFDKIYLNYSKSKKKSDNGVGGKFDKITLTSNMLGLFLGAIAGTLPDLDFIFLMSANDVSKMADHRAWSHSFFYQALATPIFAFLSCLIFRRINSKFFIKFCILFIFSFWTHAFLDFFTIYGTKIFLPFSDYPYALGSIFIIDPLYTPPKQNIKRSSLNY